MESVHIWGLPECARPGAANSHCKGAAAPGRRVLLTTRLPLLRKRGGQRRIIFPRKLLGLCALTGRVGHGHTGSAVLDHRPVSLQRRSGHWAGKPEMSGSGHGAVLVATLGARSEKSVVLRSRLMFSRHENTARAARFEVPGGTENLLLLLFSSGEVFYQDEGKSSPRLGSRARASEHRPAASVCVGGSARIAGYPARMALFSKRHKRALANGELRVELADSLRVRIWRLMQRYDDSFIEEGSYTSHLEQLETDLLDAYGQSRLSLEREPGIYAPAQFKPWARYSPAQGLLDAVEGYARHIPSNWESFRSELNDILGEEEAHWRLLDSEFVLLDSVFVHENIVARSQSALHSVRFSGAAQEMLNAQNALVDGDGRAVVHNAGKSFESVMKAALDKDHLSAQQLTDALLEEGFFDGLPEDQRGGFAKQVVGALPWMRNRLGGHGQGREAQPVGDPYARLALGLAAVLNEFVVTLAIERDSSLVQAAPPVAVEAITEETFSPSVLPPGAAGDDDIPF